MPSRTEPRLDPPPPTEPQTGAGTRPDGPGARSTRTGRAPKPSWATPVAVGTGTVAALAAVGFVDPTSTHVPLCPLKALTGLDCPACGSLRATYALLHGDLAAAAGYNLLFTIAAPALVAAWAWWLARSIGWRGGEGALPTPARAGGADARLVGTALGVAFAYAVARNVLRLTS